MSIFEEKERFCMKEDKKKIVFFGKFFYPPLGGAERFIHSVFKYLNNKGYNCYAVCYAHPDVNKRFDRPEIVKWDGIEVHRLPGISMQALCYILETHHPDILITHSYDAPIIIDVAKSFGIKTIFGVHFWRNICEVRDNFMNMLTRPMSEVKLLKDFHRVFYNSDIVYANSVYMVNAVKRFVNFDVDNIINPVYEEERVICQERDPKYITIINPDVGKGGKIFCEIARKMPDVEFKCVGLGQEIFEDNRIINKEILNLKNVKCVSYTDKVSEIYKDSRVVLVPSLVDETFSMVALESLANGIPVLCTKYGNLPYILSGEGGYVLDENNIESWVSSIKEMFDEEKYKIKSHEAFNRSLDFNPQIQFGLFEKLVKKLI